MTITERQADLPKAKEELDILKKCLGSALPCNLLWNDEATSNEVLLNMARSSWVHLACHATQDLTEPTRSGLLLHGNRLTISDIIKEPFPNADLAFLSACQTATGDEKISDEAVHIAGGMLASGYRAIIATMWSIRDQDAPLVAEAVYTHLRCHLDSTESALALHKAVKLLRQQLREDTKYLHAWVPFVHYGI